MAPKSKKPLFIALAAITVVAILVYVLWANRDRRERPLEASGTLEAKEIDVATLVAGRIVEVKFDEGDDVRAGEVVGRLDASELSASSSAAAAAYDAAVERSRAAASAVTAAEDVFNRIAAAYPSGGVTRAEYERAKAARDGARAELAAARAAAAQAGALNAQVEARRREVDITAPITGVVLSRNLEPGETLAAGTPLVTLADLRTLEMNVYVPEYRIGLIRTKDAVDISVDSFPGQRFRGTVKSIGARAEFTPRNIESKEDRVTLVFKVTVEVPNADLKLKPGMPADAAFINSPTDG